MKGRIGLALLAVAALGACGGGKQDALIKFVGFTPNTSLQKDDRSLSVFCPGCHEPIEVNQAKCKNKKCQTPISWPPNGVVCGACRGSGQCSACRLMEQAPSGKCYNCKGAGYLIYLGKTPNCPNCTGKDKDGKEREPGVCPICKGKKTCDYCGGEGRLSYDVVKARVPKGGDEEFPVEKPTPKTDTKEEKKSDEKPSGK
jgi:hypothetical protein